MEDLRDRLSEIEIKRYNTFTQKFLNFCGKSGYKKISIGKSSKLVPKSEHWLSSTSGSVFGFPSVKNKDGWPAIWGVVQELNISGGAGCGNSDQHYIATDSELLEGVYELKAGKWKRVD